MNFEQPPLISEQSISIVPDWRATVETSMNGQQRPLYGMLGTEICCANGWRIWHSTSAVGNAGCVKNMHLLFLKAKATLEYCQAIPLLDPSER